MTDRQVSEGAAGKSAMSKAMWRILPLILLAYIAAYIDRVNVSFAATQMNLDLRFSATVYGLGSGLFFVGYAVFEVPSGALVARFGPRRWIVRIMVTWGLLAVAMMFIRTPMQFYIMRFLLGAAEAGFVPGMIYYFAGWFPTAYRGRALSRIYIAPSLASVAMGGVSAWLLGLDGLNGWQGWQWLFLAQGLPAIVIGLIVWRCLPDSPTTVSWLDDPEKAWIHRELGRDAALIGEPEKHNILGTLANPMVWLLGATGFLLNSATTGVSFSAPAILAAKAGLSTQEVGHLVSGGGVVGAICVLVTGRYSDQHGDRFRDACWAVVLLALGLGLIGFGTEPIIVITGYLLFAATAFPAGVILASSWADVLHVRQLAVGCGAINTLWQVGSFLSPYVFGLAKDATGNFDAGMIGSSVVALALAGYLRYVRARVVGDRRARAMALAQGR